MTELSSCNTFVHTGNPQTDFPTLRDTISTGEGFDCSIEVRISDRQQANSKPAGRDRILSIVPSIVGLPRDNENSQQELRIDKMKQCNHSIYMINATSLAKPHALQHLAIDLIQHNTDIAIVTETWLKNHHSTELYHIDDYICHRRDRQRRRGGGVAIFAKADMKSELFIPPGDRDEFEILWIKVDRPTGSNHYVGALYHPPKPVYCVSDLVSFIESTLDYIMASDVSTSPPLISLSGDFNQLNHIDILSLGLLPAFYAPTHKGHNLDRIYVSQPAYSNAKVVQSTVVTEHRAVVARDDNNCIVDFNKKTNTATIRLRTPRQHAAVLSHLQTYSWDSVCSATEVQQAADLFYDQMKTIVDDYYPMSTITTTSRDPGFVTPEVKSMLRKKIILCVGAE